ASSTPVLPQARKKSLPPPKVAVPRVSAGTIRPEPPRRRYSIVERILRSLSQPPAIERDEPLPMPLGRGLVVAPALREGEAVMDTGMELDLARGARLLEKPAQLLDHGQGRELVVLGAGDVELAPALAQRQMRALDGVADQPGAVERGRRRDALGIARRR